MGDNSLCNLLGQGREKLVSVVLAELSSDISEPVDVRLVQNSDLEVDVLEVTIGRGGVFFDKPRSGFVNDRLCDQRNSKVITLMYRWRETSVEIIEYDSVLTCLNLLEHRKRSISRQDTRRRAKTAGQTSQ